MLKIAHKKTKRGSKCDECRRRHIRCDLTRPSCVNCSRSERFCSFQNDSAPGTSSVTSSGMQPGPSGDSTSPGSQVSHSTPPLLGPHASSPTVTDPDLAVPSTGDPGSVNIGHIQLFHYFTTMPSPYPGMAGGITEMQRSLVLKFALSTPYLMHEMLAFSARRQSIEFPHDASCPYWRDQAQRLQTSALSLFNARPELTQQNAIPIFLFAGMLGIHLLSDTLGRRGGDDDDLAGFVDAFVGYMGTHRSLRALVASLWPMLINTELRPILTWSAQAGAAASMQGDAAVSPALRDLFARAGSPDADALGPEAAAACLEAVRPLEWALCEPCEDEQRRQRRVQVLFSWPLGVPEAYIDLLAARRPEALVVLWRYAALLCHCRDLWMVGDAGRYLTRLVGSALGEGWGEYEFKMDMEPTPPQSC